MLLLCTVSTNCVTLTTHERTEIAKLKALSINPEEARTKNPVAAGFLALLPGVGNFYLGQVGIGLLNLVTWPYSIVWAIPQSAIDAKNINMRETVSYYSYTKAGKAFIKKRSEKQIED